MFIMIGTVMIFIGVDDGFDCARMTVMVMVMGM